MMLKISLLCIFLYGTHLSDAYKALVIFPVAAKSHSLLGDGVVKRLLEDGQEVTYITPFPKSVKQRPTLREIDVSSLFKLIPSDLVNLEKIMNKEVDSQAWTTLFYLFLQVQAACLEHPEVQKLLNDPKEKFDVVIVEWMYIELLSGVSAVFDAPYIWVSTMDAHWMVLRLIDESPNPAYLGDSQFTSAVPFTFMQRTISLMKTVYGYSLRKFYVSRNEQREYERILVPIIRKRGYTPPDFEEVRYNASLMLGNTHVSLGEAIRLPQNYKPLGGYHIDDKISPLPENLKELLDNAKHGLIYFSLGSILRSNEMPVELKSNLLKMFGKLKQTVLWKFEEDLPNRPSNVHIVQWAPQQSVLAHQNCILFITHGGLLSTIEAMHFGKLIIGIPVFADQFHNVDRSVRRGYTIRVDLSVDMSDELQKAIEEILTDPSYMTKLKQLSFVYHDRPVSPGKEMAHWVKHVVSTRGAPHLRSPALIVPWYQKLYLDLVFLIIVILCAIKVGIKKIICSFSKKQKTKTN